MPVHWILPLFQIFEGIEEVYIADTESPKRLQIQLWPDSIDWVEIERDFRTQMYLILYTTHTSDVQILQRWQSWFPFVQSKISYPVALWFLNPVSTSDRVQAETLLAAA